MSAFVSFSILQRNSICVNDRFFAIIFAVGLIKTVHENWMTVELFIERFSIECQNQSNYQPHCNTMNQWELKVNMRNWLQARENACDRSGAKPKPSRLGWVGGASFFKPITERSKIKPIENRSKLRLFPHSETIISFSCPICCLEIFGSRSCCAHSIWPWAK